MLTSRNLIRKIGGFGLKSTKYPRDIIANGFQLWGSYEGDGKIVGEIMNTRGTEVLCVDNINTEGFQLSNGWTILGPTILFPHTLITWKIKDLNSVCEESLSIFTILKPKVEVVFFGYDIKYDMLMPKVKEIRSFCQKHKINIEIMSIQDACASFNFCSLDRRFVAAALIPPKEVTYYHSKDPPSQSAEDSVVPKEGSS